MNALLLTTLNSATPSGIGALLNKKAGPSDSTFAELLSQQSEALDPQLLEMLQSLNLDPKAQKELLAQLEQLGIAPEQLKDLALQLQLNYSAHTKNALNTNDTKTNTSSLDSKSNQAQSAADFISSTLFVARESSALRQQAQASSLTAGHLAETSSKDNAKPLPLLNAENQNNTKPLPLLNTDHQKSGAVRMNLAIDDLNQNNGLAQKNKDQANRATLFAEQLSLKQTAVPLTQTTATPEFSLQNLTQSALQVSSLPATPLASSHSLQITTPVQQTAQWGADFSRVMVQLGQKGAQNPGLQTAEIRLDPPELGPLRIVLSVTESVANAMIFAAHAQTRLTVEQALPQLQQQLAQAGLSLGEANVSDQGFSAQSEQHADKNPNKPATFSLTGSNQSDDNSGLLASATDTQRVDSNAIIDTFA